MLALAAKSMRSDLVADAADVAAGRLRALVEWDSTGNWAWAAEFEAQEFVQTGLTSDRDRQAALRRFNRKDKFQKAAKQAAPDEDGPKRWNDRNQDGKRWDGHKHRPWKKEQWNGGRPWQGRPWRDPKGQQGDKDQTPTVPP